MTQPVPTRGKPRLVVVFVVIALLVVAVDQVTKIYAVERLTPGVLVPVLGDVIGWQLIFNPGAAFSMATGMTWVLTLVALVVVVVVLRVARRLRSRAWTLALGLLLGGALGNLIDRLVREPGVGQGHVVDFINYNGWFIGNVADIAIVLAAVLVAVLALIGVEVDGSRAGARAAATDPEATTDDSPLSEEPDVDEDEFTPLVPAAGTEEVDLARWVSDSEPAADRRAGTAPADPAGDAPAPGTPTTAASAADLPASDASDPSDGSDLSDASDDQPAPLRPRWRSRRDMRTGTADGPAADG